MKAGELGSAAPKIALWKRRSVSERRRGERILDEPCFFYALAGSTDGLLANDGSGGAAGVGPRGRVVS